MSKLLSKEALDQQLVVNVKDFGAVGNAVKDDSDAIEAAIKYAMHKGSLTSINNNSDEIDLNSISYPASRTNFATQGGAKLYFPSGTYRISRPIVLPASGGDYAIATNGFCIHIEGENSVSTMIAATTDFAQKLPNYDTREVRGLIEWDPNYNYDALEPFGNLKDLKNTVKADWSTWQTIRQIRELIDLDERAEELFNAIFEEELDVGGPRLREVTELYQRAVDDMKKQAIIDYDSNGKLYVKANTFPLNRALHQSIKNITLKTPERPKMHGMPVRTYAIYRRWPWMMHRPILFDLIEAVIVKGKKQASMKWFPDNTTEEMGQRMFVPSITELQNTWREATEVFRLLWQGSMEGSRMQLHMDEVNFYGCNGIYNPAICRFEGSMITSSFKNINAKVSDEYANSKNVPHARSGHYREMGYKDWLGETDLDMPSHDCILFEFDQGVNSHYGMDTVGLQYSQVENVWAYGKQLGVFKGRANGVNWRFAFSDGSLFGPSYHFINSTNTFVYNIYHEGGYDRHVFLLERCLGLRLESFGTGGQRLTLGASYWPDYAKKSARTLSSSIKLKECVGCRLNGREGLPPRYTSSYYMTMLLAEAHNSKTTDPDEKYIIPSPKPVFLEVDDKSSRNVFTNIESAYIETASLGAVEVEWIDENGKPVKETLLKQAENRLTKDPKAEINALLTHEFKLPSTPNNNFNSVTGWLYIHEYFQHFLNNIKATHPKVEYHKFGGSNELKIYKNAGMEIYEWGGIPINIGHRTDDPKNKDQNDW